jgi:hypothetical protein
MNYKWTALSNTIIGTLMASLDRNIILIALPAIALDLHTSFLTLIWIVLVWKAFRYVWQSQIIQHGLCTLHIRVGVV